jgi:hypothetical protein
LSFITTCTLSNFNLSAVFTPSPPLSSLQHSHLQPSSPAALAAARKKEAKLSIKASRKHFIAFLFMDERDPLLARGVLARGYACKDVLARMCLQGFA